MILHNEKKKTYIYRVYGLNIESDIIMPALIPIINTEHTIDVTILCGKIPQEEEQGMVECINNKSNLKKISYVLEGVAGFYVASGNTIIVEPCDNADMEMVKTYLLGYTFGILLFQRNNIAIHGGTVVIGDRAIIFTGDSGAGKSTLTTTLRNKGYKIMSDDTSVTAIGDDKVPVVHAGYPEQKLCRDMLIKLGYNPDECKLIDKKREKYVIPVHKYFSEKTMRLGAIFEITESDNSEVEIEKVIGINKLKVLQKNIYGISIAKQCSMSAEYLKKSIEIAQNVAIFRIKRPKNKFSVEEQIAKLEETLKEMDF